MSKICWISPADSPEWFPDVDQALREPDGLLAIGGDLSPARVIAAYRQGIFPWYDEDQPILWWSPDPRAVIFPDELRISRSLRKTIRQNRFDVTFDRDFESVIRRCAAERPDSEGTWITSDMHSAYVALHELGYGHSVEAWNSDGLVGGVYGLAIGRVFFGESMFSHARDASKVALAALIKRLKEHDYVLLDCQVESDHLTSLGSRAIPRSEFIALLEDACGQQEDPGQWPRRA